MRHEPGSGDPSRGLTVTPSIPLGHTYPCESNTPSSILHRLFSLRIGEFTWTTADWNRVTPFSNDITRGSAALLHPGTPLERFLFTLPASKTDPFWQGIKLTIAAAGGAACAVAARHHLISSWPGEPQTPLFSNIPFNTLAENHGLANFDRNWVVAKLRDLLLQEGVAGYHSGHSFRRGGGTWEKQAGISDSDIQLLVRWNSDAYKRCIEVHPKHIFGVSHRLQTFSPSSDGPPRPAVSPPTAPVGPRDTRKSRGRRVGVIGRAGRGAREPRPASRAASPRRGCRSPALRPPLEAASGPEATSGPARGPPPAAF